MAVFILTGMLAENEHLAHLLIGLENTNLKKPVLLFNPFYLGDIESGPFLLEANYDGSSTIRGDLWSAKIFRVQFLYLESNF